MAKVVFWKDKAGRVVDPALYSGKAEILSKQLAKECETSRRRQNKRTQVRKFYDEVLRLEGMAKARPGEWVNVLPLVHMLAAKAAYANGRSLVSDNFVEFVRSAIDQIEDPQDLKVFANFFEAFMGFYRRDCPAD